MDSEVTGSSSAVAWAGRPNGENWFLIPEIDFKRKLSILISGQKLDGSDSPQSSADTEDCHPGRYL